MRNPFDMRLVSFFGLPVDAPSYDELLLQVEELRQLVDYMRNEIRHLERKVENCVTLGDDWEYHDDRVHARQLWYALGMQDDATDRANLVCSEEPHIWENN